MLFWPCICPIHRYTHKVTQSHAQRWLINDTMTLEEHANGSRNASSLTQSNMCRRKLQLRAVKLIYFRFFGFSAKCAGNHAFVLKCASVKLFLHTSCLYISYFVFICVCVIWWVLGCMVAASFVLPAVLTWCCVDCKHSCRSEYQIGQTLGQCRERARTHFRELTRYNNL